MPKSSPRSPGLRKFITQPDCYAERYGNFTLTRRDLEILETVYRYRYIEARHIRALVGGSDQQISRRLQGLFHNGYLGRYARRERMRMDLDPGAPLMAYGLDLKGARALERTQVQLARVIGTSPARIIWRKDYTRRTEFFLEHQLMISNFRCVLQLAHRDMPHISLVSWNQGRHTQIGGKIPGRGSRLGRIAPDAYFKVQNNNQLQHFFLEADRATEEHRRIHRKFVDYWHYVQDEQVLRIVGARPRVRILFLCASKRRATNLIMLLKRMPKPNRANSGGRGMFLFSHDKQFTLDDVQRAIGPVWSTWTASGLEMLD